MNNLDKIDEQILNSARKFKGCAIATVIKPLVNPNFFEFGLRDRVRRLAEQGLIRLEKVENGRVLVFLEDNSEEQCNSRGISHG
ncbi:MAG: hypothetical protein MUO26_06580 [Methanotrichaceae archaeon]|nr:hypothetical protein [Methanotrichaceae archaeon]